MNVSGWEVGLLSAAVVRLPSCDAMACVCCRPSNAAALEREDASCFGSRVRIGVGWWASKGGRVAVVTGAREVSEGWNVC